MTKTKKTTKRTMSNITMIVGLPGSGKTTYAKNLLTAAYPQRLFDDPSTNKKGIEDLRLYVRNGGHAIVTDVYCTDPEVREIATAKMLSWSQDDWNPNSKYKVTLKWVFFENDLDACLANIKRRNEADPKLYRLISEPYLREASRRYIIPDGAQVLPVYKP